MHAWVTEPTSYIGWQTYTKCRIFIALSHHSLNLICFRILDFCCLESLCFLPPAWAFFSAFGSLFVWWSAAHQNQQVIQFMNRIKSSSQPVKWPIRDIDSSPEDSLGLLSLPKSKISKMEEVPQATNNKLQKLGILDTILGSIKELKDTMKSTVDLL